MLIGTVAVDLTELSKKVVEGVDEIQRHITLMKGGYSTAVTVSWDVIYKGLFAAFKAAPSLPVFFKLSVGMGGLSATLQEKDKALRTMIDLKLEKWNSLLGQTKPIEAKKAEPGPQVEQLNKQVASLSASLAATQEQLQEAREQVHKKEMENASTLAAVRFEAERARAQAELDRTKAEAELRSSLRDASQKLAVAEQKQSEIATQSEREKAELRRQQAREKESYEDALAGKQSHISKLTAAVSAAEDQAQDTVRQLEHSQAVLAEAKKQIEDQQAELESLRTQVSEKERENAQLTETVTFVEDKLIAKTQELERTRALLAEEQAKVKALQAQQNAKQQEQKKGPEQVRQEQLRGLAARRASHDETLENASKVSGVSCISTVSRISINQEQKEAAKLENLGVLMSAMRHAVCRNIRKKTDSQIKERILLGEILIYTSFEQGEYKDFQAPQGTHFRREAQLPTPKFLDQVKCSLQKEFNSSTEFSNVLKEVFKSTDEIADLVDSYKPKGTEDDKERRNPKPGEMQGRPLIKNVLTQYCGCKSKAGNTHSVGTTVGDIMYNRMREMELVKDENDLSGANEHNVQQTAQGNGNASLAHTQFHTRVPAPPIVKSRPLAHRPPNGDVAEREEQQQQLAQGSGKPPLVPQLSHRRTPSAPVLGRPLQSGEAAGVRVETTPRAVV